MNDEVVRLKQAVRAILREGFEQVQSARADSGKVHLEVWSSRSRARAVGLEMGHDTQVNFWVVRPLGIPASLPPTVERHDKDPKGPRTWIGADGKGANSNLGGYDAFRTRPLARLEVRTEDDARIILGHLMG